MCLRLCTSGASRSKEQLNIPPARAQIQHWGWFLGRGVQIATSMLEVIVITRCEVGRIQVPIAFHPSRAFNRNANNN